MSLNAGIDSAIIHRHEVDIVLGCPVLSHGQSAISLTLINKCRPAKQAGEYVEPA